MNDQKGQKTLESIQRLTYGNTRSKSEGRIDEYQRQKKEFSQNFKENEEYSEDYQTQIEEENINLGRHIGKVLRLHSTPSNKNPREFRSWMDKNRRRGGNNIRGKSLQSENRNIGNEKRNRKPRRRNRRKPKRRVGLETNRNNTRPRTQTNFRKKKRKNKQVKSKQGLRNNLTTVQLFKQNLQQTTRESVGVTRRTGYGKPLQLMQPKETPMRGGGVNCVGSEFLDFVGVYPSSVASPLAATTAGDVLMVYSMNPQMLAGTRLAQMATLYQKYKFHHCTFEYVPSTPSTQDGSLMMFTVYDPAENYSVTTNNPTELMRLALAHQGANIFNSYDYGRTTMFSNPDSLLDYYNYGGEDAREEMQGYFVILAASSFTNTSTAKLTIGSVVMHYDCSFYVRDITEPVSFNSYQTYNFAAQLVLATFPNIVSGQAVALNSSATAIVPHTDFLYILKFVANLKVNGADLLVFDETGQMTFGSKGSIWYGRYVDENSIAALAIYSSMEFAMDPSYVDTTIKLVSTILVTWAITGYMEVTGISLTDVGNE